MTDNPNPIEPPFFKEGLKFLQINANTFKIESEITCEYIPGHKDNALFVYKKSISSQSGVDRLMNRNDSTSFRYNRYRYRRVFHSMCLCNPRIQTR